MEDSQAEKSCWPLSYQMSASTLDIPSAKPRGWSHELYRGPNGQPVKVLYSRTIQESEAIAQQFLNEPIIGFDMEWNWWIKQEDHACLQERIGLIQLACEDKIGLFHIGVHPGTSSYQLIAPSLCQIIEDPNIVKTGVNIVRADFSRLRDWFEIEPQGAFELSHLHNLVTYGNSDPARCTTKLFSLDKHVETHLGLQLPKGDERMSRWNRPLSDKQKSYAAADAYAGFMLYHCMNAKRIGMTPQPPLPIHADTYQRTDRSTLLHLQSGGRTIMTVTDFFEAVTDETVSPQRKRKDTIIANNEHDPSSQKTPPSKRRSSQSRTPRSNSRTSQIAPVHVFADTDTLLSTQLYEKLRAHRISAAKQRGCSAFVVAHNTQLLDISRRCPTTVSELLEIKGIGKSKVAEYGPTWLSLVGDALQRLQKLDLPGPPWKNVKPFDVHAQASTVVDPDDENSTKAVRGQILETPAPVVNDRDATLPPSLHTGLSFSIATTTISEDDQSDSTSAFEDDMRFPTPSRRERKSDTRDQGDK